MHRNDVLISEGNRPWWQLALASVFFTACICIIILLVGGFKNYKVLNDIKSHVNLIEIFIFLFTLGTGFSTTLDYHFDFNNKRYKKIIRLGPIRIGGWRTLSNLQYVSVFLNSNDDIEVNLWYGNNRHFNLFGGKSVESALDEGKKIAQALQIDLLDAATDPRDSQWVDLG